MRNLHSGFCEASGEPIAARNHLRHLHHLYHLHHLHQPAGALLLLLLIRPLASSAATNQCVQRFRQLYVAAVCASQTTVDMRLASSVAGGGQGQGHSSCARVIEHVRADTTTVR